MTHEWLSETLFGLCYRLAGWSGVVMLTAGAAAAAVALMAGELRRWLGLLSVIASLGMTVMLLLASILVRPHVVALPLLVLWTVQMLKARRLDRAPPLWLLPLMVLWANLHGSGVFGLAFTGFFALEAFFAAGERRFAVGARWGAFIAGVAVMALITPNGVAGVILPFKVLTMTALPWVNEWAPANFGTLSTLEFALMFTLFICLYRGVRVPAVRLGLLLILLHMSLQHLRQEIVLAVIAPLLLAEPLGRALEPGKTWPAVRAPLDWPRAALPTAHAAAAGLALAAGRLAAPVQRTDRALVPVSALAHVPKALLSQPVFNDYSFGGWLIFKGVKVFIDGRADMYGDAFLMKYLYVAGGNPKPVDDVFARYHIAWTIVQPSSPLVARLDAMPGWRRLYADKWAVVHVRADAPGR